MITITANRFACLDDESVDEKDHGCYQKERRVSWAEDTRSISRSVRRSKTARRGKVFNAMTTKEFLDMDDAQFVMLLEYASRTIGAANSVIASLPRCAFSDYVGDEIQSSYVAHGSTSNYECRSQRFLHTVRALCGV